MPEPVIRVEDLYKSFGDLEVVKGVSLSLEQGKKLSILGPSGSGKSTILRCINYLEEPTKGHIYLDGQLVGKKWSRAAMCGCLRKSLPPNEPRWVWYFKISICGRI